MSKGKQLLLFSSSVQVFVLYLQLDKIEAKQYRKWQKEEDSRHSREKFPTHMAGKLWSCLKNCQMTSM
jgi:hypothetical protein